jgi:hypothetical protein
VLEDPEGEDEAARVTGVFEAGIRVFMDCYFENIAEAPQDSYFVTADDSGMRTFIRTGAGSRFFCAKETR